MLILIFVATKPNTKGFPALLNKFINSMLTIFWSYIFLSKKCFDFKHNGIAGHRSDFVFSGNIEKLKSAGSPFYSYMMLWVDTVQDFLIKLGIKPRMHVWEISILSLNNVIVRPTKILNSADKNWAHFYKTKYFKNQSTLKIKVCKKFHLQKLIS